MARCLGSRLGQDLLEVRGVTPKIQATLPQRREDQECDKVRLNEPGRGIIPAR
jgi:hypothetical protein